ncbi:MAG: hypothetical protein K1X83_09985 [Oligoflexia bacterium]|nr:hypothetical protein [Oligoflexia bacterium]
MTGKMSELDQIIPPEVRDDPFYFTIEKLAREEKIKSVLEIGSSSGAGSTRAFISGLGQNPEKPTLYCMEVSRTRFAELQKSCAQYPFVRCYNTTSVAAERFPKHYEVVNFYNSVTSALNNYPIDRVLGWLDQDLEYLQREGINEDGIARIKRENNITDFDMVLIDGSEFTGVAELEQVYGAKLILLDDINAYKNRKNYDRLAQDSNYTLIAEDWHTRNGFAVFRRNSVAHSPKTPVHFFTIVLNGEPFIRHHIDEFERLKLPWHWHIIEGVASLVKDTSWSVQSGGVVSDTFHRNGLSTDGTTEYLDELKRRYPQNISIYRPPSGKFWDGKVEMCNAPIPAIQQEGLLWQLDSDELWTAEQIEKMAALFEANPDRTGAFCACFYFVGPDRYVESLNAWSTLPQDWPRVWRFKPGMYWATHEPAILVDSQQRDVMRINPFSRDEMLEAGLAFQHYAYVTEEQLTFKERYYGYANALALWKKLQAAPTPLILDGYLPWSRNHGTVIESWKPEMGELLADRLKQRQAPKRAAPAILPDPKKYLFYGSTSRKHTVLIVRTDAIGDNILFSATLDQWRKRYPNSNLALLCRSSVAPLYKNCPHLNQLVTVEMDKIWHDAGYRAAYHNTMKQLHADIVINAVYSRDSANDFVALMAGGAETFALSGSLANTTTEQQAQANRAYTRVFELAPGAATNELAINNALLNFFGVTAGNASPTIWLDPAAKQAATELFAKHRLVPTNCIGLFAGSQTELKTYPAFAPALRELIREQQLTVLAFGSESEKAGVQTLLNELGSPHLNLCGTTSVIESAAIIQALRMVVGNDTSGTHIACAVGTPNVCVIGGAQFGRFLPYSELTSLACLPLECWGCNWKCKFAKTHCVKDVAPEVVTRAVREALGQRSTKPRIYLEGKALYESRGYGPEWKSPNLDRTAWEIIEVENNHRASSSPVSTNLSAASQLLM